MTLQISMDKLTNVEIYFFQKNYPFLAFFYDFRKHLKPMKALKQKCKARSKKN